MCSECLQTPCDPRCPNAEPTPREPVAACGICDDNIYEGDDVIRIDDCIFHYDCVKDLPFSEILDLFGISAETMGEC